MEKEADGAIFPFGEDVKAILLLCYSEYEQYLWMECHSVPHSFKSSYCGKDIPKDVYAHLMTLLTGVYACISGTELRSDLEFPDFKCVNLKKNFEENLNAMEAYHEFKFHLSDYRLNIKSFVRNVIIQELPQNAVPIARRIQNLLINAIDPKLPANASEIMRKLEALFGILCVKSAHVVVCDMPFKSQTLKGDIPERYMGQEHFETKKSPMMETDPLEASDITETVRTGLEENDALYHENIQKILNEHYAYGFKFGSMIQLMRFRQFAEKMEVILPEMDECLISDILSCGTVIGDKLFCNNNNFASELREIVEAAFSDGKKVIYYKSLLEKNFEWMNAHVILSEEMLRDYLKKTISGYEFSKRFMAKGEKCTEKEAVTFEIERVWGERQIANTDTLSERLPYIPLENIERVISGNDMFVNAGGSGYLFIDRIKISEDEAGDILDYIESICEKSGFVSLTDIPMESLFEKNYDIPKLSLYNAVYKKVLAEKYRLKGNILTREQSELNVMSILKQDIRDKEECNLEDVAKKVLALTGWDNRQYMFQVLYDTMVRVDKSRFVAFSLVNFDVEKIDDILGNFITNGFCAVRDVTTFAMFPVCGQSWNHYLLESYCYKYSKKYSLCVMHFNDKNVGIITEKNFNKSYTEMLAIALSKMNVELTEVSAGKALFDAGYLGKSKCNKLAEIIQQAEVMRNKG